LFDPCISEILFPLIVECSALSLLIMKCLNSLVDHILIEVPFKLIHVIIPVGSFFDEIFEVFLRVMLSMRPSLLESHVELTTLLGAETGLFFFLSLYLLHFPNGILIKHLLFKFFACVFLHNHLADNFRFNGLLVTHYGMMEVIS
jgi:hypothetical protein